MNTRHIIAAALLTFSTSAISVTTTDSGPIDKHGQIQGPNHPGLWYVSLIGTAMVNNCANGAVYAEFNTATEKAAHKMLMNTKLANDMGKRTTDQLNQALSGFSVPPVIWDDATVSITYDIGTFDIGGVTVTNACFLLGAALD